MEKKKTEMTRLRSASSKTYVNQDHSYTKEIYLDEIHYRDLNKRC